MVSLHSAASLFEIKINFRLRDVGELSLLRSLSQAVTLMSLVRANHINQSEHSVAIFRGAAK